MTYCPNCRNILDISKNALSEINNNLIDETPDTISQTDTDTEVNLKDLLQKMYNKIISKSTMTQNDLNFINTNIYNKTNDVYKKLDTSSKKIVNDFLEKFNLHKENNSLTSAYYVCLRCKYSKPIEPGTLITSRSNTNSLNTYTNLDILKNAIHDKTLLNTRDYICKNSTCKSHNDFNLKEAVFTRIDRQIWYVCKSCVTYWKGE
jgi:hypothetical protein